MDVSPQFLTDAAAALNLSTTKTNKALAKACLAEAARMAPVTPPAPPPVVAPPAPPVVVPPATGVRPFSSSSPFNTPTPAGTVWANPAWTHVHWWVDNKAANIVHASATDPTWTLNCPTYIATDYHRNRPAQTFTGVHAPATVAAGGDSDKILVLIQPDGTYHEFWQTVVDSSKHTITGQAWATGNAITGPGAGTLANNDGVRAANFSWAAGLITPEDIAAGVIDHALVVALADINTGPGAYVAPATAFENSGNGGVNLGVRIGIPAGTAKPTNLTVLGGMVFDALVKYGAFVGDFAADDGQFYAQSTVTDAQITPLYDYWDGKPSDLDLIQPLLRQAA